MKKRRYAQVGIGGRSGMYTRAVTQTYADRAELVGLCDVNMGRVELRRRELRDDGYGDVPGYPADEFDRMVADQEPDCIVVTTRDCDHDTYISRAMELGCDVITEKPMTTDEVKCQRIVDTVRETGRDLRVTFNYRYAPPRTQVKELLMEGTIGTILSVDFSWNLDTRHGADYYRRWHRNKANSGGLMVHKATHHFDLVNWWISSTPETVCALGRRRFYTPETADKLGFDRRTERCHTCPHLADGSCPFALDLASKDKLRRLYLDQEQHDGYFRDRCVFGAEIDIEDSMNLAVRYRNGVHMAYCLNSFLPWEGYRIAFNGDRGRLEAQAIETVYISGDETVPGETVEEKSHIRVFPHFADPYEVPLATGKGGHGGGDSRLLHDVFDPDPAVDRFRRAAGLADGAWSILTGVAANKSMAGGGAPVHVPHLVSGLPRPEHTRMPD
ncbi:MAG: Gfo/Idh/MocA family oxidoreductase [Planctomycetota bacterium]